MEPSVTRKRARGAPPRVAADAGFRKQLEAFFEAFSDGTTVWVNGSDGLIGRFGPRGVDVHADGKCLPNTCTSTLARQTVEDWRRFRHLLLQYHNVNVSDSLMPKWLR